MSQSVTTETPAPGETGPVGNGQTVIGQSVTITATDVVVNAAIPAPDTNATDNGTVGP